MEISAFVMEGGQPHVSPVWVDRDGDIILVNTTDTGRVKSKYLKPGSKVALSVFDQNNPYSKVVIRGKVIERTKKGASEHIDKLAKKYINQDKYPWNQHGIDRIIVKIETGAHIEGNGLTTGTFKAARLCLWNTGKST